MKTYIYSFITSQLLYLCIASKVPYPLLFKSGQLDEPAVENEPVISTWPSPDFEFGQVAGIGLDSQGNVHVFHRGSRVWDGSSFNGNGDYLQKNKGPIEEATHLVLDKTDGTVLMEGGAKQFYMPHGLHVDPADNVWVTDVALHQVFKHDKGSDTPSLVLGGGAKKEPFKRGSDKDHFCQPTDVAVSAANGDIFVSDGYCNSRILRFSADGTYISEFGTHNTGGSPHPEGQFRVPHSLTLVEDWDLLCVADRENERVQCFAAGLQKPGLPTGQFIKKAENLGRIYAIDNKNHYMVGVTNRGRDHNTPRLFVVDLETGKSIVSSDAYLQNPHDVTAALGEDGNVKTIYVAEIGPNVIRRIDI